MADLVKRRGLYFEEFAVGDTALSAGRTVSEADIVGFAGLSGDYNPIHVDASYAAGTLFGERVAHGLLGLSIASGLAMQLGFMDGTIMAFMGLNWEFRGPIKIGDTIRLGATVNELRAMPRLGGGFVTFKMQVLNQRDETVQRGTWQLLVKAQPKPDAG